MDRNEVIEGLRGLKELFREGANLQIVLDEAIKAVESELILEKKNYEDFNSNDKKRNIEIEKGWFSVKENPPQKNGSYLVTVDYGSTLGKSCEIARFANILEKIDDFDFYNIRRPGWYRYDSEYGYYEIDNVIAWMERPKPYEQEKYVEREVK